MKHSDNAPRMLIAAREEPLRRVLSHLFADSGAIIDHAASHGELLSKCRKHPYRLIITRFVAPLVESADEIGRIRNRNPKPVLFVLSHTRRERIVVILLERGVSQFLNLPVSSERLLGKVRKVLSSTSVNSAP